MPKDWNKIAQQVNRRPKCDPEQAKDDAIENLLKMLRRPDVLTAGQIRQVAKAVTKMRNAGLPRTKQLPAPKRLH